MAIIKKNLWLKEGTFQRLTSDKSVPSGVNLTKELGVSDTLVNDVEGLSNSIASVNNDISSLDNAVGATQDAIASLEEVAPTKIYAATLAQSGANAPVATIAKSNIGTLVWNRGSEGVYSVNLGGNAENASSIVVHATMGYAGFLTYSKSSTEVTFYIYNPSGALVDYLIDAASVSIFIYE